MDLTDRDMGDALPRGVVLLFYRVDFCFRCWCFHPWRRHGVCPSPIEIHERSLAIQEKWDDLTRISRRVRDVNSHKTRSVDHDSISLVTRYGCQVLESDIPMPPFVATPFLSEHGDDDDD